MESTYQLLATVFSESGNRNAQKVKGVSSLQLQALQGGSGKSTIAQEVVRRVSSLPDGPLVISKHHAKKDPVPDALKIGPDIQVCLVEGNYLLSNEAPWDAIAGLVHERWLVTVDQDLAIRRIANRHLEADIEDTMEKALKRTLNNDMRNDDFIIHTSQGRFDIEVESVNVSS